VSHGRRGDTVGAPPSFSVTATVSGPAAAETERQRIGPLGGTQMPQRDRLLDVVTHGREIVIFEEGMARAERGRIFGVLREYGFHVDESRPYQGIRIDRFISKDGETVDMMKVICRVMGRSSKLHELSTRALNSYPEELDFDRISQHGHSFASFVRRNSGDITSVLTKYETHAVAADEIDRALDLFEHLDENRECYSRRVGNILTFLPRNQPLYALSCFSLALSYLATRVYTLFPSAMQSIAALKDVLRLRDFFPNVEFPGDRETAIETCAQLKYRDDLQCWRPNVDVVVFTGTPENARKVQRRFDDSVLFIANGAGHNPVVITPGADLEKAVDAVIDLQLYNQGQDCASPSAILVHAGVHEEFVGALLDAMSRVKVGPYADLQNTVGPITKLTDLERIMKLLADNQAWISGGTPGIIHFSTQIVEPTVILKPLSAGGNYQEQLAPIFFVQQYDSDERLASYFERQAYWSNAMYVTVFGHSNYVEGLVAYRTPEGRMIHDETTILRNKHLHEKGVERGVKPYGGYGMGASWLSINGERVAKPTLPQRDIFEQLVRPSMRLGGVAAARHSSQADHASSADE
jgi:lysyl-tRNA synthetase, class I